MWNRYVEATTWHGYFYLQKSHFKVNGENSWFSFKIGHVNKLFFKIGTITSCTFDKNRPFSSKSAITQSSNCQKKVTLTKIPVAKLTRKKDMPKTSNFLASHFKLQKSDFRPSLTLKLVSYLDNVAILDYWSHTLSGLAFVLLLFHLCSMLKIN